MKEIECTYSLIIIKGSPEDIDLNLLIRADTDELKALINGISFERQMLVWSGLTWKEACEKKALLIKNHF